MFGIGLSKILFTVAVILIVVYGWKWVGRVQSRRRGEAGKMGGRSSPRPEDSPAIEAEEMVQCPVCGDYVPARRPNRCDRDDCPYPG